MLWNTPWMFLSISGILRRQYWSRGENMVGSLDMEYHAPLNKETNEASQITLWKLPWSFTLSGSVHRHFVFFPIGLILPFMIYYPWRWFIYWQPEKWLYWEERERKKRTEKDWDGIELYVLFIGECFYSYLLLLQIKVQWQILWKSFQRKCLRFKCIFFILFNLFVSKNKVKKNGDTCTIWNVTQ